MPKLDLKDRKILVELDLNARMPLTELSKKVGLSRQVVEYRIKRMQEENIILGAKAVFDTAVIGYSWYRIMLRLLNITKEQKTQILTELKSHPHTFWLGEVGEDWDIVVNLICKDHFQFNNLFEEFFAKHSKFILDYEVLIYLNAHDFARSYLTSMAPEREELFHEMKVNPNYHLDALDKRIIAELSQDAWINNIQLGQKLGVAGNTIKNRIDLMTKNKLLLGFRLFINPSVIGYQSYMLFLGMNKLNLKREAELFAFLSSTPQITFAVKHIGKWRIGLEIETKTLNEFQDIFVEIRGKFADIITDFDSFPLFKDHMINYFPEGCLV